MNSQFNVQKDRKIYSIQMIYKRVGLNTYISTKLTKSKIVMRDKGYYIINK